MTELTRATVRILAIPCSYKMGGDYTPLTIHFISASRASRALSIQRSSHAKNLMNLTWNSFRRPAADGQTDMKHSLLQSVR